jgi:hypothetical protein
MAYLSVAFRAQTAEGADASADRLVKGAATAGARWRLSTGLEIEIVAVTPAT